MLLSIDRERLAPRCAKDTPMVEIGHYCVETNMFVEAPKTLSLRHLVFLRFLAAAGRLEHGIVGPPSGEATQDQPPAQPKPVPLLDYTGKA